MGWLWLALAAAAGNSAADQRLLGVAARSVHLAYVAPEAVEFYNRVRVTQSQPGTYVGVCGFEMGYFGLQELAAAPADATE